MNDAHIRGDWGSTRLRLWLMQDGVVADRCDGPGIVGLQQPPSELLLATIAPWRERDSIERITLCGTAGARSALREAPYVNCPVTRADWTRSAMRFTLDGLPIRIAAGCANADKDLMRGEETQAFGAIATHPELAEGRQWMVLPGTHSKWLSVENGSIMSLRTFLTGELFALLQKSSLVIANENKDDGSAEGFATGVAQANDSPGLLGTLFATRAAQLRQGRSALWAQQFLSGLLIGTELADMRSNNALPPAVTLIGNPGLTARYHDALTMFGVACDALDGEACAMAGLNLLDCSD